MADRPPTSVSIKVVPVCNVIKPRGTTSSIVSGIGPRLGRWAKALVAVVASNMQNNHKETAVFGREWAGEDVRILPFSSLISSPLQRGGRLLSISPSTRADRRVTPSLPAGPGSRAFVRNGAYRPPRSRRDFHRPP